MDRRTTTETTMRVNRLTADDAKLPRNLRRVLAGIRKPLREAEHAILKARIDAAAQAAKERVTHP